MENTEAPMTAEEILVRLSHLARTAKSESLQLRALQMLMRHYGMLNARSSRNSAPAAAPAAAPKPQTPGPAQTPGPVARPTPHAQPQAPAPMQAALRPHLMQAPYAAQPATQGGR